MTRMQQTGKYVLENGVYYPVYSYSFTTDYVPTGVILWGSITMIDFMGADGKIPSTVRTISMISPTISALSPGSRTKTAVSSCLFFRVPTPI